MAQVIFDELGLDGDARHDVEFLIVEHLEMSRVTFRRDNSDARVIREFSDLVGTEERLQMLCLLTLADVGAVSPGTLTPWKEDLLWEVFVRTYNQLTHGYGDSTIAAGEAALAALESGRPADLAADELSHVLEGFPRRYLTSVDPTQVYRHVRLARNLRRDEVHLLLDRRGDAWELAVVALDKPHLFSNICGTLAFCGMDILRGSAMTSRSGLVLDLFHFVDGEHFFDRNTDGPARFEALLQEVVAGRDEIAARLLRKEKGLLLAGRRSGWHRSSKSTTNSPRPTPSSSSSRRTRPVSSTGSVGSRRGTAAKSTSCSSPRKATERSTCSTSLNRLPSCRSRFLTRSRSTSSVCSRRVHETRNRHRAARQGR